MEIVNSKGESEMAILLAKGIGHSMEFNSVELKTTNQQNWSIPPNPTPFLANYANPTCTLIQGVGQIPT